MGVSYKCGECGSGVDVVAGAAKFPGMSVLCPSCGSQAKYHPSGLDDFDGPIVRVELGDDGKTTRPLMGLTSDPYQGASVPTVRVSALDQGHPQPAASNAAPVGAPYGAPAPAVPAGQTQTPKWPPSFAPTEPDGHRTVQPTPLAGHGPEDIPTVTKVRELPIGPAHAQPAVNQPLPKKDTDTDPGYYKRADHEADTKVRARPDDAVAQTTITKEREPDGNVGGKAWSASVIRRALRASGVEDSGPSGPVNVQRDSTDVRLRPDESQGPQMQVALPGARHPFYVESEKTISVAPQHEEVGEVAARSAVVPASSARTRVTGDLNVPPESGPIDSILFQEARRGRTMLLALVLGAIVVAGLAAGYLLTRQDTPPGADPEDPTAQLAAARAETYDLDPIAFDLPFTLEASQAMLDYPSRLLLRVELTNDSGAPVHALRLGGSWHVIHDVPSHVFAGDVSYDPEPTATRPLGPGQTLIALVEFESEFEPPGQRQESFVWLTITAIAGNDTVQGAAAMVEVE